MATKLEHTVEENQAYSHNYLPYFVKSKGNGKRTMLKFPTLAEAKTFLLNNKSDYPEGAFITKQGQSGSVFNYVVKK